MYDLAAVGKHCCEAKSIARDSHGRYVFLAWQAGHGGHSFVSDDGIHWRITPAQIKAHDDANIIYAGGRFVDLQILKQRLAKPKRYCDNTGCGERRVITSLTSVDGVNFSAVNKTNVRVPDAEDPPELEFYRIRPFAVSGSDRFMAHVLHYAPSPAILKAITNGTYGLTPSMCYKKNHSDCHGPHLCTPSLYVTVLSLRIVAKRCCADDEWWSLPRGADAADVSLWQRPYRACPTPAAPRGTLGPGPLHVPVATVALSAWLCAQACR